MRKSFRLVNKDLARKLAQNLGCHEDAIKRGIEKSQMDRGELKAWKISINGTEHLFINSFAANDPLSAFENIRIICNKEEFRDYNHIGLLNLRKDRADRSHQWLNYLKSEDNNKFDDIYVSGLHSRAFVHKLGMGKIIKSKDIQDITKMILENCNKPSLIFGLMNIGDLGLNLIEHWKTVGKNVDI